MGPRGTPAVRPLAQPVPRRPARRPPRAVARLPAGGHRTRRGARRRHGRRRVDQRLAGRGHAVPRNRDARTAVRQRRGTSQAAGSHARDAAPVAGPGPQRRRGSDRGGDAAPVAERGAAGDQGRSRRGPAGARARLSRDRGALDGRIGRRRAPPRGPTRALAPHRTAAARVGSLSHLALVAGTRSLAQAERRSQEAITLAETLGSPDDPLVALAQAVRGIARLWRGQLDEAEQWIALAERVIRAEHYPPAAIMLQTARGRLELVRGRYDDSIAGFARLNGPPSCSPATRSTCACARTSSSHCIARATSSRWSTRSPRSTKRNATRPRYGS